MFARLGAPRRSWLRPHRPLDLWLLVGLALWLLLIGYGLRDPWPADEPRFALIGRDIIETGRWLVPHRGPEVYAEKPPIFLWLQAAAYALTGSTRWAFLLPSLLAALGTLALVFAFAKRLYGHRIAVLTTVALLVTVQFTLQGRTAQIDATLAFFTTLGLVGLLRHLLLGPAWGWYALAGAAMGLGVITKGTGFLPWLIFIPYLFARYGGYRGLAPIGADWRWSWGPLAFFGVIVAWGLPILWLAQHDPEIAKYRDDLFFRQTVTRLTQSWHHIKPFWYYVTNVVPGLWLPLSLLAVFAFANWRRRLRRRDARTLLLLGWVALVVVFFSLSPGKRGVYILPAVPALALALGPLLPGLLRSRRVHLALLTVCVALALIVGGAALAALIGEPSFARRIEEQNGVAPWPWLLGVALVILVAALVFRRRGALAFLATMVLVWSSLGLFGFPTMDRARSGRALMDRVLATLPTGSELAMVSASEHFLLQAQGEARVFGFKMAKEEQKTRALAWAQEEPSRWLMIQSRHARSCLDHNLALDMGWSNRRHWLLFPSAAIAANCTPSLPEDPRQ